MKSMTMFKYTQTLLSTKQRLKLSCSCTRQVAQRRVSTNGSSTSLYMPRIKSSPSSQFQYHNRDRNTDNDRPAINDSDFSFQWRMAIQTELQNKITSGYQFQAVATQHSRMIVNGMWVFETKANSKTNAIDFYMLHG